MKQYYFYKVFKTIILDNPLDFKNILYRWSGIQKKRLILDIIDSRSVNTTDFMTAKATALPHEFVEHVSTRIVNEIDGISRVVYDITSKPPATIGWE